MEEISGRILLPEGDLAILNRRAEGRAKRLMIQQDHLTLVFWHDMLTLSLIGMYIFVYTS